MKTKTNKQTNKHSVRCSHSPRPGACRRFHLGLDLGDRSHYVCVLDAAGQIVREGALSNTRPAL